MSDLGESMGVTFEHEGNFLRPVVYACAGEELFAALDQGRKPDLTPIARGPLCGSMKEARAHGARLFFETYRKRMGFRSPDDPRRTQEDVDAFNASGFSVISQSSAHPEPWTHGPA